MRFVLVVVIMQWFGYLFPQEIMIQLVVQNGNSKNMIQESAGLTVHPGDSLYLEVSSPITSQIEFFHAEAPIEVSIKEGSMILFHNTYAGVVALNKINITRTQSQYFQPLGRQGL